MDSERFLRDLPTLFGEFPHSEHPVDRRFAPIVEQIANLALENNLALLNLAASCLGPEESYVEVGVYHGASLVAAMLGNDGHRFVGIDSFDFRDGSHERVEQNLALFGVGDPELVVGDAFELVPRGALDKARIGTWYYDAVHTCDRQLEGLRIAEPWLAGSPPHRRRHRLGASRTRYRRLPRRAAARESRPHDRRQRSRVPTLVRGNAAAAVVG